MFSDDTGGDDDETEFVIKKSGSAMIVWAVVDGQQVFHAEPELGSADSVVKAGVETFVSRAFQAELADLRNDDSSRGIL
jgi:hypothetical protein